MEDLYHATLDASPGERESFLNKSCHGDESLRREVESLLAYDKISDSFIDTSPESLAAEMFSTEYAEPSLIGDRVGHYDIVSRLGVGGMGEVYLADDARLHRKVALKILHKDVAADAGRLRRFRREAQAASALNHPNILTIYEFGFEEGVHYLVTEYVEGDTLRYSIKTGKLSLKDSLNIAEQAAFALSSAHAAGIVHRDIKPENIMIRRDGIVKLLDFGLAKLLETTADPDSGSRASHSHHEADTQAMEKTNPGMVMGTVSYMSPEQARGKETDARTDIWGLGAVLYEMIAGRVPFAAETMNDSIAAILTSEPPALDQYVTNAPVELQQIVQKTLVKNLDERYQTARDLMNDLKNLRRKLDLPGETEHSVPRYHRENLLTKSDAEMPGALADEKSASTAASGEYIVKHTFAVRGTLAVLVLALAAIGYFTYFHSKPISSIAVMPFSNETGNANNEYMSDGLSDSLINKLSQLPGLKVIARSSAFKYKGKEIDVAEISKALGVQAVITGRVTQQGDNLQISVEMINATDNTHIWGETYNRKVSAELNVPEAIAQAVSERLQLKLSGAQELQMAKQITQSPQAYQAYMNGVFFRRKNGAENVRKAIEYQKQAIALDPNFARSYTELSINLATLVEIVALSPKEGMPQARSAAESALALDDTLADAHYSLARVMEFEFDRMGAENSFKRAIELNPNLAGAHTLYAEYLSRSARFDEALREVKLAQELDPLRTGLVGNEGLILYHARRYDEAIAKKQIHASLAPENPFAHLELANAYVQKGQYAEAIVSYNASIKLEETTSALIYLGRAYALAGRRAEAMALLEKLKRTEKYVSPTELAILYAALGDKEKAFASLEKAYADRDIQLTFLKVEPAYDPLRDDPRFQPLLNELGFAE
ncbi:MAG: protein kinase [Pyrinomonadaceae bacterium]